MTFPVLSPLKKLFWYFDPTLLLSPVKLFCFFPPVLLNPTQYSDNYNIVLSHAYFYQLVDDLLVNVTVRLVGWLVFFIFYIVPSVW